MTWVVDWPSKAACKGSDPDQLFVQGAAQNRVKSMCLSCAVRTECLADALDHRIEFGVWGGMTERERRALLRRRPNITSWRRLLEAARDDYDRACGEAECGDEPVTYSPVPAQRAAQEGHGDPVDAGRVDLLSAASLAASACLPIVTRSNGARATASSGAGFSPPGSSS